MNEGQKIIRGFGIVLAIALITLIITAIFYGVSSLFMRFTDDSNDELESKNLIIENNYDIEKLEINLSYTKLNIKNGKELKAETNNKDISIVSKNHKLIIDEEKDNFFKNYKDYQLTIYVPEDTIFEEVEIETGASKVNIETLKSYVLELDLGAGKVDISNLVVLGNSKIEGGVGEVTISDGSLNNLDLDMGVGKFTLNSKLLGVSKIDAGIGEANLKILGLVTDYTINTKKGLSSITLNGEKLEDDKSYGTGSNIIDISSGIGKITIDF